MAQQNDEDLVRIFERKKQQFAAVLKTSRVMWPYI
jgi:hypothetical protein